MILQVESRYSFDSGGGFWCFFVFVLKKVPYRPPYRSWLYLDSALCFHKSIGEIIPLSNSQTKYCCKNWLEERCMYYVLLNFSSWPSILQEGMFEWNQFDMIRKKASTGCFRGRLDRCVFWNMYLVLGCSWYCGFIFHNGCCHVLTKRNMAWRRPATCWKLVMISGFFVWCREYSLVIYVPGSKLPLFPYNRGWSSTQ